MWEHKAFAVILLVAGCAAAAAAAAADAPAPSGPKSQPAVAAVRKREKAVEEAERAYRAAVLAAERQAVDELRAAQVAAMKVNNLPEANASDAEIKAAEARIDLLTGKGPAASRVQANRGWQPVGKVKAGQRYRVTAKGTWCIDGKYPRENTTGPDGNGRGGYLEARVGEGKPFRVGSALEFTADADGNLEMEVNDSGSHDDNTGSVDIVVSPVAADRGRP